MLTRRKVLVGIGSAVVASGAIAGMPRASWMRGKWGLMVHWVAPGPYPRRGPRFTELDAGVRKFSAVAFAQQVSSTGAKWVIFTIGQNTGYYCSPNSVLDERTFTPHTSRRDMVMEIIEQLDKRSIAFIAYLPAEVNTNPSVSQAFEWSGRPTPAFQRIYTDFIGEYSRRFADGCKGWWFDGCYDGPPFPNKDRDWDLWLNAARAGNPNAALAFNNGCFHGARPWKVHPDQDFLSGETSLLTTDGPTIGQSESGSIYPISSTSESSLGCIPHAVAPIDSGGNWVHIGPGGGIGPTKSATELRGIRENFSEKGWALSFNVGVYQEGLLVDETLKVLRRIRS